MSQQLQALGFQDDLKALNGVYKVTGSHHGKPLFKKPCTEIEGCTEACIYFWDESDGESFSGFWVAPIVGGEQVWAFNPAKTPLPPATGWRVPFSSPTADPNVKLIMGGGGQQQANGKGATQTQSTQQTQQQGRSPAPAATATQQPQAAAQQEAQVHPQVAIRQRKLLDNLDAQVSNIEKTAQSILTMEPTPEKQPEISRKIGMAKNSVVNTRKFIETQKNQHFIGESAKKLDPISARITAAEKKVVQKEGRSRSLVGKKVVQKEGRSRSVVEKKVIQKEGRSTIPRNMIERETVRN